ncbi:type II toxin-antitoxin system VapC family toxin [Legionella sp. 16cNR16C]|uniref:type II toxin-antitoxin system VapC family toxin n=1 Tax=Legionella sp. 16cNR16C TaxID=2905656 RepID=UPI001E5CAFC3|nr:type II toxin-antitoxin system VapC family toxin [Legionella sp. 16cNR16C]MCE3045046.1 type II toxin-antitoxin system VapC family toxin [Legionella sp. 16cNR16C]
MYLMDTNVVSEIRKGAKANINVISWARAASTASLFLSVISILEIEMGILQKERADPSQGAILRTWLNAHVLPAFADRILNIDGAVAQQCAKFHIPDSRSERDALIAATALVHGLVVVTKNIKDFEDSGLELLNPWEPR